MLRFTDAELELYRRPSFAVAFVGSTLLVWLLFTSRFGVEALGLRTDIVPGYSMAFISAQLVLIFAGDSVATAPRWAWLRVMAVMTLLAGGYVYGASSTHELSAAWVFVLPVAHLGSQLGAHRYPALVALHGVMGPLIHLALNPNVTSSSLAVSVAFGAVGAATLYLMGRRADENDSLDAGEPLDRDELAARQYVLSRVSVAMAMHDRVSGLLVATRLKVKRARGYGEVSAAVSALIERSRGMLRDPATDAEGDFFSSLREAVEAQGASIVLRVERHRILTPDEEVDAHDIVSEACLNAARSGAGTMVHVHFVADSNGVSIACNDNGPAAAAPGNGRGL